MPNTILTGTVLCCEAAISVKVLKGDRSESPSYNYELHNKPCFGIYFNSAPNSNGRTKTLVNIKADVYQYIDQDMLVKIMKITTVLWLLINCISTTESSNLCSLSFLLKKTRE